MKRENISNLIVEPLFNVPALKIKTERNIIIAIADLHIGYEHSLGKKGIIVKSKTGEILNVILKILVREKPDRLVMVGDIKDELFGASPGTARELKLFFSKLRESVEDITVVKGNHDGRIEDLLPDTIRMVGPKGGIVEGIGFFHGHSWPSADILECHLVVTAHNHPTFASILAGERYFYHPCWIRGKLDGLKALEHYPEGGRERIENASFIVMPSFTKTGKGVVVNNERIFLGPVLANGLLCEGSSRAYLLDGTELGYLDQF
ncbi:MAG: metallophosphoesterase [Candidatus Thermoplasmatota archaeon]|jgi:hypothetical protein|nr:metallophosphoesterase [Candidatus Thermoplasmatota archaeon]MDP7264560.1 metallophosphoesterase [Candidatus Thermoplasmatota archaeon]